MTVALALLAWALVAVVLALVLAQLIAADSEPSVGPWQRAGSPLPSVTPAPVAVPTPRTSDEVRQHQSTAD